MAPQPATNLDPSAQIASTARVHPEAIIGAGVVIGDFCIVDRDVSIGPGTRLEPYVWVKRWTTVGEHNEISAGTILGTDPLDKHFTGERSYLRIGNRNKIREHFTISRGTAPESETVIGDDNYIMTSGHIAHNAKIANNTVIASCALVAGYVEVEEGAFISGSVAIHQFSKIGCYAMIGGLTKVNKDAPPYFRYAGEFITPYGLNTVGLRRAGFSAADLHNLKEAYKILYRSDLKLEEALESIEAEVPGEHARHLVEFIRSSKRGIARE
jgi:UDP-N-acetylglucosamine acyltransferase